MVAIRYLRDGKADVANLTMTEKVTKRDRRLKAKLNFGKFPGQVNARAALGETRPQPCGLSAAAFTTDDRDINV
jgi:hypothetical protein